MVLAEPPQPPLVLTPVLQEGAVGPSLFSEPSRLVQNSSPLCSYALTMTLTSAWVLVPSRPQGRSTCAQVETNERVHREYMCVALLCLAGTSGSALPSVAV